MSSPSSPIAADAPETASARPRLAAGQQSGDLLVWLSAARQPVAGDAEVDAFVTTPPESRSVAYRSHTMLT